MDRALACALPTIYDAAASDRNWPAALDAVANASEARGAILMVFDLVGLPFQVQKWCTTYRDEDIQQYFREFGRYEEFAVDLLRLHPTRTLCLDTEVWPARDEVADREDYVFLRDRYGVEHRAAARLSNNKGWSDVLALQVDRHWDAMPSNFWDSLNSLMPHLSKVVEINRTFSLLRLRYQAALAALDRIGVGMCVALPNGSILVSNTEAQRIFSTGDGLRIAGDGQLIARDEDVARQITAAIALTSSTAKGEQNCAEFAFPCARSSGEYPYLVEVCPLRDSDDEIETCLLGSLVCIIDPERTEDLSADGLAILFGFSPVEKRVCDELLRGRTAIEIADIRNVSPETVRSQVKALYQKAGISNRVELMRLAISVNPPII